MREVPDSRVSLGKLVRSNLDEFRFLEFGPACQLTILLLQPESPSGFDLEFVPKFCDRGMGGAVG